VSQRRSKFQAQLKNALKRYENINQRHHFNQNIDVPGGDNAKFAQRERAKRAKRQAPTTCERLVCRRQKAQELAVVKMSKKLTDAIMIIGENKKWSQLPSM
jgi:hypothetical protein